MNIIMLYLAKRLVALSSDRFSNKIFLIFDCSYHVSILLYYDRIDVSEGIDVNKNNQSRRCIICIIITFSN